METSSSSLFAFLKKLYEVKASGPQISFQCILIVFKDESKPYETLHY